MGIVPDTSGQSTGSSPQPLSFNTTGPAIVVIDITVNGSGAADTCVASGGNSSSAFANFSAGSAALAFQSGHPNSATSIQRFWINALQALSGVTFTYTSSGAGSFVTMIGYDFFGVNTASPWDAGGGLWFTDDTGPPQITTVNPNTALLAAFRLNAGAGPPASGFTQISTGANFEVCGYNLESAAGTYTATLTTPGSNGVVLDALVAAPTPPPAVPTISLARRSLLIPTSRRRLWEPPRRRDLLVRDIRLLPPKLIIPKKAA